MGNPVRKLGSGRVVRSEGPTGPLSNPPRWFGNKRGRNVLSTFVPTHLFLARDGNLRLLTVGSELLPFRVSFISSSLLFGPTPPCPARPGSVNVHGRTMNSRECNADTRHLHACVRGHRRSVVNCQDRRDGLMCSAKWSTLLLVPSSRRPRRDFGGSGEGDIPPFPVHVQSHHFGTHSELTGAVAGVV